MFIKPPKVARLTQNARIIRSATPRFAQQISHKYANMNAPAVCADLEENHHRKIAHSYLQDVADHVGVIASVKEQVWEYATPKLDVAVSSVVISMDGGVSFDARRRLPRSHGGRDFAL